MSLHFSVRVCVSRRLYLTHSLTSSKKPGKLKRWKLHFTIMTVHFVMSPSHVSYCRPCTVNCQQLHLYVYDALHCKTSFTPKTIFTVGYWLYETLIANTGQINRKSAGILFCKIRQMHLFQWSLTKSNLTCSSNWYTKPVSLQPEPAFCRQLLLYN